MNPSPSKIRFCSTFSTFFHSARCCSMQTIKKTFYPRHYQRLGRPSSMFSATPPAAPPRRGAASWTASPSTGSLSTPGDPINYPVRSRLRTCAGKKNETLKKNARPPRKTPPKRPRAPAGLQTRAGGAVAAGTRRRLPPDGSCRTRDHARATPPVHTKIRSTGEKSAATNPPPAAALHPWASRLRVAFEPGLSEIHFL